MAHIRATRATQWKLHIDLLVAAQVEHRIMNRMTHKPEYGLRSRLVNELLVRWLRENPAPMDAPSLTETEIAAINGGVS